MQTVSFEECASIEITGLRLPHVNWIKICFSIKVTFLRQRKTLVIIISRII